LSILFIKGLPKSAVSVSKNSTVFVPLQRGAAGGRNSVIFICAENIKL
jgi:hypothetical protein